MNSAQCPVQQELFSLGVDYVLNNHYSTQLCSTPTLSLHSVPLLGPIYGYDGLSVVNSSVVIGGQEVSACAVSYAAQVIHIYYNIYIYIFMYIFMILFFGQSAVSWGVCFSL